MSHAGRPYWSRPAGVQEAEDLSGEQIRGGEHRDVPLTGHSDDACTRQPRGERAGRRGQIRWAVGAGQQLGL